MKYVKPKHSEVLRISKDGKFDIKTHLKKKKATW
jgi:hypothetical protein